MGKRQKGMKVVLRATAELTPYEGNPRQNDAAVDVVANSIREFGFRQPIVVDESGVIICGHTRYKAAQQLGLAKVPVHVARDLTPDQVKAYRLADNATADHAEWDMELLAGEVKDLAAAGVDAELLGLTDELLEQLGAGKADGLTDPDAVPALRKRVSTRQGDLWTMGKHRLVCGDSTAQDSWTRLARGPFDLVVTSPPYNVHMAYAGYRDAKGKAEYLAMIEEVGRRASAALAGGRYIAWNIGVSPSTFPAWHTVTLEGCGFVFLRQIIWRKSGVPYPIFPSSRRAKKARHYKPNYTHEMIEFLRKPAGGKPREIPCLWCDGDGRMEFRELPLAEEYEVLELLCKGSAPEFGEAIEVLEKYSSDVWQIAQSRATVGLKTVGVKSSGLEKRGRRSHMVKEHPSAFPTELPRAIMAFLTAKGERVCDPFAGSGSTLIAAEQLGRTAFLIEIDAQYCDVIVRRWQDYTGRKAKRVRKGKGRA